MRLKISKSKNTTLFYIIKDLTKNGKRSTKVVKRIGNLEEIKTMAGNIDYNIWLKNYIKDFNLENDNKETILIKKSNRKIVEKDSNNNFNVGYLFIKKLYNDLKLDEICNNIQNKYQFHFDLNEILSYLVYARIIYPSSKLETFKQCQNFIEQPKFKLHDEYRALSYIAKNIDYIQENLFNNSKNIINRNSKIIYYDCTNYFFEIDEEDDLRKYGISKEHKPNPIVGMGLFMDGDGIPLSFNIYPGNQNEQKSLIPEENKIINNFKLDDSKIVLCTDAGLASDEIKKFNVKDNRGFVITQSLKKLKDEYKKEVFDKSNWRIANDFKNFYNLDTIEQDSSLKEKYYDTLFYKIIQTETKSVKQDLIVTFSFKYFDYNRNIRNSQIERARKSIENNQITRKGKNQNDYRRFIDSINSTDNGEVAENITYSINQDIIAEEEKYDGYYALTTNLVGDVNEIFKVVKGRWEIEESFRIMKSDFLARPVNLSREDRIKSHFLTCFISLFLYRLLEKKLEYKYTTSQILNTLRNMNVLESKGDGYIPIYTRTDLTDELHNVFNFRTDYEINTYKNFKKIFEYINN
ncbi:MAG TPA: IS1634 family transposase [Candidatus Faecisoma merdavium]|nr:IS1634 family transposase [Candidatus Faecisoma merdavium]